MAVLDHTIPPRPASARAGWLRLAPAALTAFSLLVGLAAALQFRASPYFNSPIVDEEGYIKWAHEIMAGTNSGRTFYQDPLYPYLLALIFTLAGKGLLIVRVLQAAMGAAAVYLVYWTGRRLGGTPTGLLAAAVLALWGPLYFWELMVLKASLLVLLSAAAAALGVHAAESPAARARWFWLGLVLGLLCLLRGNFLIILPVLVGWAYVAARDLARPARILRVALVAAGIATAIFPATLRNYIVSDEIVLTTSQGGANFYIGNNDFATGIYRAPPFVYASPLFEASDFKAEAERQTNRRLSAGQVSRFWFDQGLQWVRHNPGRAARLWLHKARLLVHQYEVPDNQDFYLTRRFFAPVLWVAGLGFGVLWGPALIGAALSLRRPRALFPALFALAYGLSLIPFFIVARYRTPMLPAAALYTGVFAAWAVARVREKNFRALLPAGIFLVPALALGLWPIAESRAPDPISAFNLGNAYLRADDPERALAWHRRAMEMGPDQELFQAAWEEAVRKMGPEGLPALLAEAERPEAAAAQLYELGRRVEDLDQPDAAEKILERVLQREPDHFPAHARLAGLLAARPDPERARAAERHLQRALELSPGYGQRPDALAVMRALGDYYYGRGEPGPARRWYREVLRRDPSQAEVREKLERLEQGPAP